MARYEHLPIYRAAFDLAVHLEKIVRHFSRYHKYTLGTELRDRSRRVVERIVEANGCEDRASMLLALRADLESLKLTARLCQETGAFSSTRSYLVVAEKVVGISKQNEGWIRQAKKRSAATAAVDRTGKAEDGRNRAE